MKKQQQYCYDYQDSSIYEDFSKHPLAHLFYKLVKTLKARHFHKEAEDLLKIAQEYYLPENRDIITKIIVEMQKAAIAAETNKFRQLLRKL